MTRKRRLATWTFAILVLLGAAAYAFIRPTSSLESTAFDFSDRVGEPIPDGVRIVRHASAMNDNFFHTTHYWLLEGDPDALRKLVANPRFGRSDEDASWILPAAAAHLDMKLGAKDLAEGYESDHPRNRWFLILTGSRRAIYVL